MDDYNQPASRHPDFITLPSRPPRRAERSPSALKDFLSVAFVLVAAVALAFALVAFVFQSYQVDGPSMENTLQNGDRLIVWKVPRTISQITHQPYVPAHGDIIVFTESNLSQFGQADVKQLVKRVIGTPGDRIVIHDGTVTVYNRQHPSGFQPDKTLPYGQNRTLPYTSGDIDTTLKNNQIFVMGDNRTDSLDSRAFGPVNLNDIVGKLVLRVYPFNTFQAF